MENKKIVPGFLVKLKEMVNESLFIEWNPEGTSFVVQDQDKFSRLVLPKYFKHSNFTSFIRQLNMYGFHKLPNKLGKSEFCNEFFQRDKPELMDQVVRRRHNEDNLGYKDIVLELQHIKQQQLEINQQLLTIKNDSQMIYGNSLQLQQQYFKQKDTIDKILQFLAKVYGKNELENLDVATVAGHSDKKIRYLEHMPSNASMGTANELDGSFLQELPHKSAPSSPTGSTPMIQPIPALTNSTTDELDELFSTQTDAKATLDKANMLGQDIDVLGDRLFDIQNNLLVAGSKDKELDFDEFFNT